MIKGFRHAAVVVKDMQRALRFYRGKLGLKVEKVITIKGKHLETIFNKKEYKNGIKLYERESR